MELIIKTHFFIKVAVAKKKQVSNYEKRICNILPTNIKEYAVFLERGKKNFGIKKNISFNTILSSEKKTKIYGGSDADIENILTKRELKNLKFFFKAIRITNNCNNIKNNYNDLYIYLKRNSNYWSGISLSFDKHEIFTKQKDLLVSKSDPNNWRPLLIVNNNLLFICLLISTQIQLDKTPKNFLNFNLNKNKNTNKNLINSTEPFISCSYYAVKHKNQTKDFIQLDLSKAYDNVDWKILKSILPLYLDEYLSKIIIMIITESHFTFNKRFIKRKKGIAQGIPFSPQIFCIVMFAINTIISDELLKIGLKENRDYINNLWVDDIAFYFLNKKSINLSDKIFTIMNNIYTNFGFSINMKKSWKSSDKIKIKIRNIKFKDQYLGLYYSSDFKQNLDLINVYIQKRFEPEKKINDWVKKKKITLYSIEKNMDTITKEISVKIFGCLNYYFCGLLSKKFPNEKSVKKELVNRGYPKISEKVTILQKKM